MDVASVWTTRLPIVPTLPLLASTWAIAVAAVATPTRDRDVTLTTGTMGTANPHTGIRTAAAAAAVTAATVSLPVAMIGIATAMAGTTATGATAAALPPVLGTLRNTEGAGAIPGALRVGAAPHGLVTTKPPPRVRCLPPTGLTPLVGRRCWMDGMLARKSRSVSDW